MLKKRLVIVSHVFSPSNHPNAKRPYLMAKYLVRKGWDVTVFTTALQTGGAQVQDLDGIHVECIPSLPVFVSEHLTAFPRIRKRLLQMFQGFIFPDMLGLWMRKVARRLKKMEYDCGILNVLPYASFLLTQDGVLDSRWIVDYQESVYPYLEGHQRTSPLQKFYTPRLLALERKSLLLCGGAWFTSRANQNRYIADAAVDESKAMHLPYFYDPDMYPESSLPVSNDVMTVLYGGGLDSFWRSPEAFFRAWATFREQFPESFDKVRMVLYGTMDEGCRKMAKAYGVYDQIEICKPIPYREFLGEAKRATALLYIDARDQEYFNPGKIADYFGTGQPVLAFTSAGSEAAEMLERVGMKSFIGDLSDTGAGVASLGRLWMNWKQEIRSDRFSTHLYSTASICGRIENVLRELVGDLC